MNKKDIGIIFGAALLVILWIGWIVKEEKFRATSQKETIEEKVPTSQEEKQMSVLPSETTSLKPLEKVEPSDGFPPPTVEVVNGRPERTIHMGVRQYAWDPSVLQVKKGELVRLIIHNADVQHGLVIPDLNVLNIDIPPEGAVIEFEASKVGTFTFFCSYYCGEDHSLMRGKIIVE